MSEGPTQAALESSELGDRLCALRVRVAEFRGRL